ncbi:hypothetical protein ACTPEM_26630, partial [Clostridioides difficile]
ERYNGIATAIAYFNPMNNYNDTINVSVAVRNPKDVYKISNKINKHNNIEILGHLGNPNYPIDYELIIKLAIEKNILIEINNCS